MKTSKILLVFFLSFLIVFNSTIQAVDSTHSAGGTGTTKSTSIKKTYYIYSYDGKLIAEYNQDGQCTREYIYVGNNLVAEYRPMKDKYFYYMSDQINSTRVVTDDSGNVVYSATYSPFGKKIQSTHTIDDTPKPQFSGKEREKAGSYDYFGARYYDHTAYRFNSTDPVINKKEALLDPQRWNLYSYCRNNPITYLDPDGKYETPHARFLSSMYQRNLQAAIGDQALAFGKFMHVSHYSAHGAVAGGLGLATFVGAMAAPAAVAVVGKALQSTWDKICSKFLDPAKFFDGTRLHDQVIDKIKNTKDQFHTFSECVEKFAGNGTITQFHGGMGENITS